MAKEKQDYFLINILTCTIILLLSFFLTPVFTKNSQALPQIDLGNVKISEAVRDEAKLAQILRQIGIKAAMKMLVTESSGGSAFDCHQQAHTIGRIGYKIYGQEAFRQSDYACHSGAYHGAMEAFLTQNGTDNLGDKIEKICNLFDSSFGKFECLHGVGHGVLAYVSYDMPEAVKTCDRLKDSWSQDACYGGMFMENVLTGQGSGAGTAVHTTTWVNKTDPYFPCNKIDQKGNLIYQCYQMQTSWMLTIRNYSFDEVAKDCLGAPQDYRSTCFKSFGRDAAGQKLRDAKGILEICNKVPKINDYFDQCITGGLNVIVDFWGQSLFDQASSLCKIVPANSKSMCWQLLAGRLTDLYTKPQDIARVCQTFEENYKNLCAGISRQVSS